MPDAKTVFVLSAEQDEETIAESLGRAEYSYYFVLQSFRPVLQSLGAVVSVRAKHLMEDSDGREPRLLETAEQVDAVAEICRRLGHPSLHLCFSAPHRTPVEMAVPTIPVFAWEYPDLPSECWDEDPRNDWRHVLRALGAAITHSTFSAAVIRAAMGDDYPVVSIPAPVWDRFAALRRPVDRGPELGSRRLEVEVPPIDTGKEDPSGRPIRARATCEIDLTALGDATRETARPRQQHSGLSLSGVVYTTVFSPRDGRKNWREILRAFCVALRDRDDATLVMKLVGGGWQAIAACARELARLRPFDCRVVVIDAFLSDEDYARLAGASTYALNASSGEGQCLPLMQYMSLGKPAVAPAHTGMADYVDDTDAFIVATTPEPAVWPHDPRAMYRTFQQRLDVASLMAALRESHRVASEDPARYRAMSLAATERLRAHCSEAVVAEKLAAFLAPRLRTAV